MLKNIMGVIILSLISISTFAATCPSVQDIKQNQLQGWKLYDADDNKPLSVKRASAFRKDVNAFAMAEWSKDPKSKGMVQCFYRDLDGSNLEAYLAKSNFNLGQNKQYWYDISGHKQCAAQVTNCDFQSVPMMQASLTKINS